MRRYFCWAITAMLLFADTLSAHTVDSTVVLKVARHFFYEYTASAKNSSPESVTPRIHSVMRNRDLMPLLYFVNIESGGFLIIAGDTRAYPVLAHNEDETWTDDRMEQMAPAAVEIIHSYADQIRMIIDRKLPEDETALQLWSTYQNGPVRSQRDYPASELPGMESMHWDQDMYYNHLCPATGGAHPPGITGYDERVPAGCVAVAMAQIMNYWDWPASNFDPCYYEDPGNINLKCGDYSADPTYGLLGYAATSYDFSNMPDALNDYNDDVAKLIAHAGYATHMDYAYCESSSNINNARDAFVTMFRYSSAASVKEKDWYESWAHWEGLMVNEIDCGRPFYYRGTWTGIGGHAFVGYAYRYVDPFFQFKFNWGWGGNDNQTWYTVRNVSGYDQLHFNDDQKMITELYPIGLNCPFWNYHIYPTTSWKTHSSATQWYGWMVYKVNVINGATYTFKTGCGDGASADFTTALDLYDHDCDYLVSGNWCDYLYSLLQWTATYTGNAYLKVRGYMSYDFGDYTLAYKSTSSSLPELLTLQNILVPAGQTLCNDATLAIVVAGDGTYYVVSDDASVTLVAGEQILLKPGFHALPGSYFHAYISDEGCMEPLKPGTAITASDDRMNTGDIELTGIMGAGEMDQKDYLKVYPNPTTGELTIEIHTINSDELNTIQIYDFHGRIIQRKEMTGPGRTGADLSAWPSGMYLVRVIYGERGETVKVIKQD